MISRVALPLPYDTNLNGFIGAPSQGWGDDPPSISGDDVLLSLTIDFYGNQQKLALVRALADSMKEHGIHWMLVNFPVSPKYKNTKAYSLFGPSWNTAHDIIDTLKKIDSGTTYFHFYDANICGDHDYAFEDFCDENHLSTLGALKLSMRVDSLVHTILP